MSHGPEFFQTMMGRQFYDGTMPEIARQLKRLADALEVKAPAAPPVKVPEPNAPPESAIVKTLELSTGHVGADTAEKMDTISEGDGGFFIYPADRNTDYPHCWVTVMRYSDYGWFVSVPQDPFDEEPLKVPPDMQSLINVLRYAQKHDIRWLVFDRDAEIIPGLTTYCW